MTSQEEFESNVWFVLEEIKTLSLYNNTDSSITYRIFRNSPLSKEKRIMIIKKLSEWGAIQIIQDYSNPPPSVLAFFVIKLLSEFNEYHKKYEPINLKTPPLVNVSNEKSNQESNTPHKDVHINIYNSNALHFPSISDDISKESIRQKKNDDKLLVQIFINQKGEVYREPKDKYCYKMGHKSARFRVVNILIDQDDFIETKELARLLDPTGKKTTKMIRGEISNINRLAKKFLNIDKLIICHKGNGYKIGYKFSTKF